MRGVKGRTRRRRAGPLEAIAGQGLWQGMPGQAMQMPLKGENVCVELAALAAAACNSVVLAGGIFCPVPLEKSKKRQHLLERP